MKSEAERAISCVVALHNNADILIVTVESLVNQSLPPAEIVVVDDGSSDGGRLLAAGRGLVRLVPAGTGSALDAGVVAANGEFLHFPDAGDRVPQGSFAAMLAALRANPGWDAVFGRWRSAHLEGEQTSMILGCGLLRRGVVERGLPIAGESWLTDQERRGAHYRRVDMVTLDRAW